MVKYIIQNLIAIDQLINTIFGGYADETLSAKAHRCQDKWNWNLLRRIANGLFFWQEDHCLWSYKIEKWRQQLPPEYRT